MKPGGEVSGRRERDIASRELKDRLRRKSTINKLVIEEGSATEGTHINVTYEFAPCARSCNK